MIARGNHCRVEGKNPKIYRRRVYRGRCESRPGSTERDLRLYHAYPSTNGVWWYGNRTIYPKREI
nr:MAG TPA: hypothetical protein [Caudoviricetes sp.]